MIELQELLDNGFVKVDCKCKDCQLYPILTKDGKTFCYSMKTKRLVSFPSR
jgi:hypothetical protein